MALRVRWTPRAEQGLENVLGYLEYKWTSREIQKFGLRLDLVIQRISENPEIYPKSDAQDHLRKALVNKNNYIIYRINWEENLIEILNLRSTRQKPLKE